MAVAFFVHRAIGVDGLTAESGAKLYAYVKGTTTPQTAYLDPALTTPSANPQIGDSLGLTKVYFSDALSYSFEVKTSDGATVLLQVDFTTGGTGFEVTYATGANMNSLQEAIADLPGYVASDLETIADEATASRAFGERQRERMSILDFVDDAAERTAILAGTSTYDSSLSVQAAVDWAMGDAANRDLLAPGGFVCASDITDLHSVQVYGPGWIEIGTGGRWYFDANQLNSGFGALDFNTLYVDPQNGDDTASGLAEEFAVETGARAAEILSVQGSPLGGYFQIQFVDDSVVTEELSTFNFESGGDNPVYIFGAAPASDWDNSDPPDDGFTINSITAANPPVVTVSGVRTITITNGGTGYTSTPSVGFSGGGGSGAVAEALVEGGVVTMIEVTTPGTGYTSAPTVSITGGGGASAAATANIGHNLSNGDKVFLGLMTRSGGAHQSDGAIYTVANKTTTTFELSGINGSAWSAVTGGFGWRLHKSRPKTVIYGDGTDFVGVRVTRDTNADVRNFFAVNCGSYSSTDNGAAVVFSEEATGYARNIQAAKSQMAVMGRESLNFAMVGGSAVDCWNGSRVIAARYTIGAANVTSTQTTTPLFKRTFRPIEVWEGANGHADGVKYMNNSFLPFIWKGGQMSAHYSVHINTSATPARGYVVDSSGYAEIDVDNSLNVFRGLYKPRLELRANASQNVTTETSYTWRTPDTTRITITPAGGQITVLTFAVPQGQMNFYPQGFRIQCRGTGTWANGSLIGRIKKGSTTLYSRTILLDASARELRWDFDAVATGFDAVTIDMREFLLTGSTTTSAYDIGASAFDTITANDTLTFTVEVAHASDTFTVQHSALELLGW